MAPWGDPGVTEEQLLLETPIAMPTASGGRATGILQRAGFLKRLRFNMLATFNQTAGTGAPSKSGKGPLGAAIDRLTLQANGMLPLIDLSGLMAQNYNEIQNRDGSSLAPVGYDAASNISAAATLMSYSTPATGVVTYTVKFPFEFQLAIPLMINQQKVEWGLWLLQNQSVDLGLQVSWNAPYSAAASPDALYSGGTAVTGSADLANYNISIERSLYSVPAKQSDYPDINWAHQIIEFTQPITANFARFDMPKAGILLRALIYTEDASAAAVEYTDIKNTSWVYGANANPINRTGPFLTHEYLLDYDRYPPKGVIVLDFYKWGGDGLKLVKSTQDLANLRIETNYTATASGKQRIVLDRMVPVARMAGG
jgi:hypothetical protein